jgi:hypothetical protein
MSEKEPILRIEMVGEDTPPKELPSQGVLIIGSARDKVGLLVSGQGVAEVHCAIGRTKDGDWAVKDLGSEYGTLLNGGRVTQARVATGDELLLGSRRLTITGGASSTPVATPSTSAPVPSPPEKGPAVKLPRIRGYRATQRLGRGAQGDVFLAVQESLDREVALKVLSARLEADQAFVASFQAEARSAAALNHPNVVTVHDVGESEGVHFLTMEYMDRGSLEERVIRDGPLHWKAVLDSMHDAASGLVYAESRGIVHRDIKPANLMQNHTGTTKIADLGLATTSESETLSGGSKKIFGTPHFIAPELVRGETADCRSDLYSLGATAYRLLTGHTPFDGDDSREILRAKLFDDPTPLRHYITDIPEPMVRVVDRLMHREPAERFPSASSLLKELDKIRKGGEAAQVGAPAAGRSRLPKVLVPLLLLIAASVFAVMQFGGDSPEPGPTDPGPAAGDPAVADVGETETVDDISGNGETEPVPSEVDDDAKEQLFELRAKNAFLTLSGRDLSDADRRDQLRQLATEFAGTTTASEASEEAERLAERILQENQTQLEEERVVAEVVGALRAAAALDSDPIRAGDSLRAMTVVPGQEELEHDPVFREKRLALETEVLSRAVVTVEAGLDQAELHHSEGDFEAMSLLLGDLLMLTDLPEFPADRKPPGAARLLELRTRVRNRRASIQDLEVEFGKARIRGDATAMTEALRGNGGLAANLSALDFAAAGARIEALSGSLATEAARSWSARLLARVRAAEKAIPILVSGWDSWRRKTVFDPRERRSSSHEALGVTEEGIHLKIRDGQELVPWSAFGGHCHDLNILFAGRLSRDYTAEELESIAALMSLSAVAEAVGHAVEMFEPDSKSVFTAKEQEELPSSFDEATEWCDAQLRAELDREREASVLLASALRNVTESSWAGAASSLQLLIDSYPDTLVVRLLSDGGTE